MEFLRRFFRNWLGFSRTEVNGFLILLPLMTLLIASEPVYRWWISTRPEDHSHEAKTLDSLVAIWNAEEKRSAPADKGFSETSRFSFDPNTCSLSDLKKLGFSNHLSMRIVNYREKGGTFRIKRDLLKIYGVDSTFYHQLFAYILLPEKVEYKEKKKEQLLTVRRTFEKFDLNKADTAELKTIYGIGTSLASRIIRFRNGLGGFIHQDQLREVYGLDSLVVAQLERSSFIAADFEPRKININTGDEKILSSHPYVNRSMAKAIISYRFQHGAFTDVQDLRKIALIKPEDIGKLMPYFTTE